VIAFDQSRRPVRTADFDYGALDPEERPDQRLKERLAVSEYFRLRYEWIMAGWTMRSRQIRRAIVEAEIDGTSVGPIAKQFGVTRQSVYEQLKELRNLTPSFIGKND
jgi:DNA-directed RNA polymerase specialized sigma24 family protein